jgi:hypothetical protein
MTGHDAVRAYQPRPELVRLEKNDQYWSVWLSPEATVVELAALMGGLGCKCEARDMGEGAFAVFPMDPHTPAPTAGFIVGILEHGIGRLPSLLCKQAG